MISDNEKLRALFTLPPMQPSTSTALVVPELPPQEVVTGDKEIDAVLWLRQVIRTGQQPLIDKAMKAATLVKTPLDVLQKRYTDHMVRTNPGNMFAALSSFSFADLKGLAEKSVTKLARQHEAFSRFGAVTGLFKDTQAETICKKAMRGLKRDKTWQEYKEEEATPRFMAMPELAPNTLADCLYARAYGTTLYWLRHACADNAGDHWPAFQAHRDFCFQSLARIAPRSRGEALAVLEYLIEDDAMGRMESNDILRNLVGGQS